jgi:ABC-type glycerol-3-phosphate transport system substrate-binding protein
MASWKRLNYICKGGVVTMRKMWFALLLVVTMFALSNICSAASSPIKLVFWSWGGPEEQEQNSRIVAEFNAAHPGIEVEYQAVPDQYDDKLIAAVLAGKAPDIFYVQETNFVALSRQGLLLDQQPFLKKMGIDISAKWHPQAQWWYEGQYYGTTLGLEPLIMFYNNDLFLSAGLEAPPASPRQAWSWTQFTESLRRLTRRDADGKVTTWGGQISWWWFNYLPYILQTGALPFGENHDVYRLVDNNVTEPLQALADLALTYGVIPRPADTWLSFPGGQVGLITDGQWALQSLTLTDPMFDLRLAVIPRYGAEFKSITVGAPAGVYSGTKYPAEAVEFALWLTDNSKAVNQYATGLWVPTEREWLVGSKRRVWLDAYPQHHPPGFFEAVIGSLDNSAPSGMKEMAGFGEIWNGLVGPALNSAWNGDKSVAQVMQEVRPEVEAIIKKYAQ